MNEFVLASIPRDKLIIATLPLFLLKPKKQALEELVSLEGLSIHSIGGPGEGRTRVQTTINYSFYKLISFSLVRTIIRNEQDTIVYPLNFKY